MGSQGLSSIALCFLVACHAKSSTQTPFVSKVPRLAIETLLEYEGSAGASTLVTRRVPLPDTTPCFDPDPHCRISSPELRLLPQPWVDAALALGWDTASDTEALPEMQSVIVVYAADTVSAGYLFRVGNMDRVGAGWGWVLIRCQGDRRCRVASSRAESNTDYYIGNPDVEIRAVASEGDDEASQQDLNNAKESPLITLLGTTDPLPNNDMLNATWMVTRGAGAQVDSIRVRHITSARLEILLLDTATGGADRRRWLTAASWPLPSSFRNQEWSYDCTDGRGASAIRMSLSGTGMAAWVIQPDSLTIIWVPSDSVSCERR